MTKEEAGQIVIDAFEMWKSEYSYVEDWSKEDEALDMALKALDQETKTGHWIRVDDTKMRCSNCDIIHLIAQYPRIGINYCPSCGAKMSENKEV